MERRRLELAVNPAFRLHQLGLGAAAAIEVERFEVIHWDTPDRRLAAWEAGLRFRRGRGWRVTLVQELDGDLIVRREIDLPGGVDKPPDEALRLLCGYLGGAPVGPVARLRHLHHSQTAGGGLCVRHQVISEIVDRRAVATTRRINLHADGALTGTKPVVAALRRAGASTPTSVPPLMELGGAAGAPRWRPVRLDPDASVAAVVAAALRDFTARLIRNLPLVVEGSDPEGVHQARVACRRLRSALQTFEPVLDRAWAQALRTELKGLADSLGVVRDADVLLMRLTRSAAAIPGLEHGAADHLVEGLVDQRRGARDTLLTVITSPQHAELLDRLQAAATSPAVLAEASDQAAVIVLQELVAVSWRRLRRRVRRLDPSPADEELHRVRILAKRCRYAVLALVPVLGDPPARTAAALGELQDVLGDFHDAIVAADWLREHADSTSGFVAGALYAAELTQAEAGRRDWHQPWSAVARPRVWRWL